MRTSRRSFVQSISFAIFQADRHVSGTSVGAAPAADSSGRPRIIPCPKFQARGNGTIRFNSDLPGDLIVPETASAKIRLAADMIGAEVGKLSGGKVALRRGLPTGSLQAASCAIYLVDWQQGSRTRERPSSLLDVEDRAALADPRNTGQAYVIRMSPSQREAWLIGSSAQGVVYAAASFIQLLDPTSGLSVHETHIRDCPDQVSCGVRLVAASGGQSLGLRLGQWPQGFRPPYQAEAGLLPSHQNQHGRI